MEQVLSKKKSTSALEIDGMNIKKAALELRAINHRLRQQILQLIHKEGRITVTKIYKKLRLEQSVASQHLAILRNAKYVVTEREGKFIFYSVNYARLKHVHVCADKLLTGKA